MSKIITDIVDKQLMEGKLLSINLGAGHKKTDGVITLDILESVEPDIVCDLDNEFIPLPDSCCGAVTLDYVLEHLDNTARVLEEVWRIAAPGSTIFIGVPYCFSAAAYVDPTHKKFFSLESYRYFDSRESTTPHYDYKAAFNAVEVQGELEPATDITKGIQGKSHEEIQGILYRLQHEVGHIRKLNFFMSAIKGEESNQKVTSRLELAGLSGERVLVFKTVYTEVSV